MIEKLLAELYELVLDDLAERIEAKQQARARAFVDQAASPLGPRRHINAIKSGQLPGNRVGRRYLALAADVDLFIKRSKRPRATDVEPADETDVLAGELGFQKRKTESK
jgi:hypothetical protein